MQPAAAPAIAALLKQLVKHHGHVRNAGP